MTTMLRLTKRMLQQTVRVKDLFGQIVGASTEEKKKIKRRTNSILDEEIVLTERTQLKYRFACLALDYIALFLMCFIVISNRCNQCFF